MHQTIASGRSMVDTALQSIVQGGSESASMFVGESSAPVSYTSTYIFIHHVTSVVESPFLSLFGIGLLMDSYDQFMRITVSTTIDVPEIGEAVPSVEEVILKAPPPPTVPPVPQKMQSSVESDPSEGTMSEPGSETTLSRVYARCQRVVLCDDEDLDAPCLEQCLMLPTTVARVSN